jgi:hypothetical protein
MAAGRPAFEQVHGSLVRIDHLEMEVRTAPHLAEVQQVSEK